MFFLGKRHILLVTLIISLISFGCSIAKNTIVSELENSYGTLKAVVFQREAGATTGFSTQISILYKGEKLNNNDIGNCLVMQRHGDKLIEGTDYWIRWKDDDEALEVFIADDVEVIRKATGWKDISIKYVTR